MTEISNEMMNSNGGAENSEPLLVGTNTTLDYDASAGNDLTYDTESQPLAVGTNLTIEITYAEAELLKQQLGINLDGSDNYLGSNIAIIDGESDWLERVDNNPLYSDANDSYSWDLPEAEGENGEAAEADFSNPMNEPLLVGSNITFIVKENADGNGEALNQNASTSERDGTTPFALGTNMLLELPNEGEQQDNYLGSNLSTIGDNSGEQADSSGGGMMMPGASANPTDDNEDYAWDFGGQLERFSTSDSEGTGSLDPNALFAASPWGSLEETGAVDGFEDVFPNGAGEINNIAGGFGGGEA